MISDRDRLRDLPSASEKQKAEGDRDIVERELSRTEKSSDGEHRKRSNAEAAETAPGNEAAPDTPGTGENICRRCNGTGRVDSQECDMCSGTGRVVEGIGGA